MSKPERILIGTSEKELKGVILFNILSHSSGMNGVITVSRLGNHVTSLGVMCGGTA
jgi:hypothetical protein